MKNTRKVLLINPKFQFKIMGWMLTLALAPISIFFGAHYLFFWQLRKLGLEINLPADHIYFRFIEGQSLKMLLIFIFCSLLTVAIVIIIGLVLSHKIAGPIHNLKMFFKEGLDGKPRRKLAFRKGDFFLEVPPIINDYFDKQDQA
jgi:hypothetical protein